MSLSILIPTLNEAGHLCATLECVRRCCPKAEIICADGGSDDGSVDLAQKHGATVIVTPRGRGVQLRAAAEVATGDVLWFLHADTRPECDAAVQIAAALDDARVVGGNFRLRFGGTSRAARFMSRLYPRLVWLGLRYGDSGIFVRRTIYEKSGGFRAMSIFEDLDFLRRVRPLGRLVTTPGPLITSSRRFEGRPFAPVFTQWAGLQFLYWLGWDPVRLGRIYYRNSRGATRRTAGAST